MPKSLIYNFSQAQLRLQCHVLWEDYEILNSPSLRNRTLLLILIHLSSVSYIYLELTVINSVVCSQIKDLQDYILRPRLLRRMKEDVEKSIPLKEEVDLLLQDIKDMLFFSVL